MNVGFLWLTCRPADAGRRIAAVGEMFPVIEVHGPFPCDTRSNVKAPLTLDRRVRYCLEVRL